MNRLNAAKNESVFKLDTSSRCTVLARMQMNTAMYDLNVTFLFELTLLAEV